MTHWVIEKYDDDVNLLIEAVKEKGQSHDLIQHYPYLEKGKFEVPNTPTVFYGSINLGLRIQYKENWIPGVYLNKKQFECVYYYPRFGDRLLNSDYCFIPFGELKRKIGQIKASQLFIRPNSGLKSFTGKVIHKQNLDHELDQFQLYDEIKPEELVLISLPKKIQEEYRFVVSSKSIITGSMYQPDISSEVTQDVFDYAQQVLNEVDYNPDPVWTLDICRTETGLKVLEVGCFSCAGLYQCDMGKIVDRVSELAEEEFSEV